MDELSRFLRAEARRPFAWLDAHCLMLPADWIVQRGRPDPARAYRGRLASEGEALAVIEADGGIEAFARRRMSAIELPEAANPVCRGNVGLVTVLTPAGPALAGGIWTGSRWAVRGPRGLWFGAAECRRAWLI